MTLSNSFPRCRFLGHGDGHGQVAGPRPQHWWIRDRHINVVAVLREVGLPDGLNRREQKQKAYREDVFLNSQFIMTQNQVSQGLTLSSTCPFTELEELILSKSCALCKVAFDQRKLKKDLCSLVCAPCQQSSQWHPCRWEWSHWRWWAFLHSRWAESSKATCTDTLSGRCSWEKDWQETRTGKDTL